MEEARFSLLPGEMWWEQSLRPGCDHSCLDRDRGPAFSSPLQYWSSVPKSRKDVNHTYHVQEQIGSYSTFPMVKNLLQGFYSPSHTLQNTPQGSPSGQDWETLHVATVPRVLVGRNTRAALF